MQVGLEGQEVPKTMNGKGFEALCGFFKGQV